MKIFKKIDGVPVGIALFTAGEDIKYKDGDKILVEVRGDGKVYKTDNTEKWVGQLCETAKKDKEVKCIIYNKLYPIEIK